MSKKLIVANWKMNPQTPSEAEKIFLGIAEIAKNSKNTEVVVCAPFVFLPFLKKKNNKKIVLGAQNVYAELEGAYTGEISPKMLSSLGVKYVIIGHSERRAEGEKNEFIAKKVKQSLKCGLTPIICVGERERDHGHLYLGVVKHQVEEALSLIPKANIKNVVIAYEPVWAIGKNALRAATAEESMEMSIFIKKTLADMVGPQMAHSVRVLYGASVDPKNTSDFILHGGVDGLLVGRDSLNPKKFDMIINSVGNL